MKKILSVGLALIAVFLLGFTSPSITQPDQTLLLEPSLLNPLCGDGSASDQYGFTYPLQQYHWTVDGEAYLSPATIDTLDVIFDELNAGSVVQTMILFKPADQVGNRVNCAVHFLRYMQLGLPSGERKDNGFAFLIVVEKDKIDVHYGVGLGLPALTAHSLTEINRLAEDTYAETGSMDDALLAMANAFSAYAREQYPPLGKAAPINDQPTGQTSAVTLPALAGIPILTLMCLCCISILVLMVFLMIVRSLFRGGGRGGWRGGGGFRPSGGGFSGWSRPSRGSSGGFRPHLPTRGGGGSGRSNRGN